MAEERQDNARMAVLMTCHNRVSSTVASIRSLLAQREAPLAVDLFLVDDGSTDGTDREVRKILPRARILRGDGTLFWNGGMHWAFAEALRADYDFYLWLNDDTNLEPDAVARMLDTCKRGGVEGVDAVIVVGSTRDPESGLFSYGGWCARSRPWGPKSWEKSPPSMEAAMPCDTFNGNCVLIPRAVANIVGNVDPAFVQGFGDLDYGLRAVARGCKLIGAAGYMGTCRINNDPGKWNDRSLSLGARWQALVGPKGFPPRAWATFTSRHKGWFWMGSWAAPYARFWLDALVSRGRVQ